MVRPILTLGFVLACVAGATSYTTQTMSMEDALHKLHGKLPHRVLALMQTLRRQKAKSQNIGFLSATGKRGMNTGTVDKRNVQEAREMLNAMVEETQEKLDREEVQCEESIRNQNEILEETRTDMALYNFQATQARRDGVRPETSNSSLQETLGKPWEEHDISKRDCP